MTPEEVQKIYAQIDQYIVELDPNPAARGPRYMMEQISRTRGYLNSCGVLASKLAQQRHRLMTKLNGLQTAFDVGYNELLVNDNRVTRLPAIEDRRAMINMIQRDEYAAIQKVKHALTDVEHVEKAVRHRHRELEATMSAIRLQKSLVDIEVRAGGQYGDERDPEAGGVGVPEDDEISNLFDGKLPEFEDEDESESEDEESSEAEPEGEESSEDEGSDDSEAEPEESSEDDGFDIDGLLDDDDAQSDEAASDEPGEAASDEAATDEAEDEPDAEPQDGGEDDGDDPKESDGEAEDEEDPDVENFLEGEDFAELFEDL